MALVDISKLLTEGFKKLNLGRFDQAFENALLIIDKKYNIDAYMLAGLSLYEMGDFERANNYFLHVYKERSQDIVVALYFFETLKRIRAIDEAIRYLNKIEEINDKLLPLAVELYELNGDYIKVVHLAKRIKDSVLRHEKLAWNYELLNRIEDAQFEIVKGLKHNNSSFRLNAAQAKLELRKQKFRKAKKTLQNIEKDNLNKVNLSIYNSLKAQCYEGLKKYNKAFKLYARSNNLLKGTQEFKSLKGNNFYTFENIKKIKQYFNSQPQFKPLVECGERVTFLVGFPRSGTTLLENILNAHSKIVTIEEKPTVGEILDEFLGEGKSIIALEDLSLDKIKALQSGYLKIRNNYRKSEGAIVIDKLPLNIIHMGILYRIFPNAQFIISTRDVRDVALSCFFQNFAINDAMANFLDWKMTNKYLHEIMSLGLMINEMYPVQSLIIKYEEFVISSEQSVKAIIKFLGLQWEDEIKNYRKNIIGKNINTPSYASVSKKINTKRLQRWKNYTKYFN